MGKSLYIAEKPSVALEFARVLNIKGERRDGYVESGDSIVTWCVGHLITMCYPEAYDERLKSWRMETLPFIPEKWKYRVIDDVKKQFGIVSGLLNRKDVETIYVCTDSGREGEYIYRLVRNEAHVQGKKEKRVWIDSQTEEEILRGIAEAKDISDYDHLSDSAYCRAKEDYLMGINFSRALTLKFGPVVANAVKEPRAVISVGRVMTCVLGMVVRREREIRDFVKTVFYRVVGSFGDGGLSFEGEWKAVPDSRYFMTPALYKDNGFLKREDAEKLITLLNEDPPVNVTVENIERKNEKNNPPLLFNLAELQNACSKRFKKSPDETLNIVQKLYERKLVTYPRTDARVLSSAVAKEIDKNIRGLSYFNPVSEFAKEILEKKAYTKIGKSRYTDDSKITDHYAIIPTGQGLGQFASLDSTEKAVYELICRRFLSIFYPPAEFMKFSLVLERKHERFFSNFKVMKASGYTVVSGNEKQKDEAEPEADAKLFSLIAKLKKGDMLPVKNFSVKEGETTPPKRYSTGSLILAMESAGQLIEDEELRAQIKGSGIGTSATRAEILKKLTNIGYLSVNKKTQIVTPCLKGELTFDVVDCSISKLLNPELTASWEKGLSYVSEGTITEAEYMAKLTAFVTRHTEKVKGIREPDGIRARFMKVLPYYGKAR